MFEKLKQLFQQITAPPAPRAPLLDPHAGWKEVAPLPKEVEFTLPELEGAPGSLTNRQKEFLEMLKFPTPERLNARQAGVILNCIQYVRNLYADNFKQNLSTCPPIIYLNMLPFMLSRPDIREYLEEWDKSMMHRDGNVTRPFARRRKHPLHVEIQKQFTDIYLRS